MIKSSSFENEYFIILKPEGDVLDLAKFLQKNLSKQYNLYPDNVYPEIHITIDRIDKNRLVEAIEIIKSVVLKYTKLEISVKDFDCFSFEKNNFLVLNVEENKKLLNFCNELHNRLSEKNISTINNYDEWKLHISLASTVFSETKYDFNEEFRELCFKFENINVPRTCKAKEIEIWRPTLNNEEKCVKKFEL